MAHDTGIKVMDRNGNLLATLWQHLDASEVESILSDEGISTLSDWSGTWEPSAPDSAEMDTYEIVAR